jgi:hypothetical protein
VDVMNEIKEINQDQDVMLMGDFNIEVPTSNLKAHRFWKKLIGKDRRIHVEDYTTLSDQRLTSRYDHFIIDAKESSECELPEYPVLDLTIPEVFADAINISYSYDNMKGLILDQRNKYRKSLLEKTIVFDGKNEDIDYIYRPTNIDDNETIEMKRMLLDDEMSIFDERITNPYFDDENMFAVVKNLFSDHLPILIECDASSDKD